MTGIALGPGRPEPMGARWDGEGVNFAVFSDHATRMELCLFAPDGQREIARAFLPERTGAVWHGHAPGLAPGALYGLRAHGDYAPHQGHRFNPNKLLLDPYARALHGGWRMDAALFGYDPGAPDGDLSYCPRDSAPFVPKAVVTDPAFDWGGDRRPRRAWADTVIYEAHVKGLTQQRRDIPEALRGTYAGLASGPMLDHLVKLGVTAVELMPVHAFIDDGFLLERGLRNYWGYNTIGFFIPEPRYGPAGAAGFRDMVRRFHGAGIEVILDVVYNHTAEGDQRGPTLSFRGLDNASYYRLQADPRHYVNDSGCGNTLDLNHPHVLRMALDSLRFWVDDMHVDGFRFDLAVTLGREPHGFDPAGRFLSALRQDPVLAGVKLIAEPWDLGPGGYRLGGFPPEFAEWNDRCRDAMRGFWRGDAGGAQALAGGLLGSADAFDHHGRRAWCSVNFVASHDGFTLADLAAYGQKRNAANGEDNRDGHDRNLSDNCGIEGPSDDPKILARRARRARNLLATLLLSQGAPMLLAGDEAGNSQQGNNNAYCQDNPIGWVDWGGDEAEDGAEDGAGDGAGDGGLTDFVARLTALRRAHPVLRQSRFLHGALRAEDGAPDVEWLGFDGAPPDWNDPALARFCLLLRGAADAPDHARTGDAALLAFNIGDACRLTLPAPPAGRVWTRAIDSAAPNAPATPCGAAQEIAGDALVAFTLDPAP